MDPGLRRDDSSFNVSMAHIKDDSYLMIHSDITMQRKRIISPVLTGSYDILTPLCMSIVIVVEG